jgi:hypothetical protein
MLVQQLSLAAPQLLSPGPVTPWQLAPVVVEPEHAPFLQALLAHAETAEDHAVHPFDCMMHVCVPVPEHCVVPFTHAFVQQAPALQTPFVHVCEDASYKHP